MAGYYDSKFIYNKTGYWGEELYRFGIVYILHNNELSPVFNVRGKLNITEFNEENQQFKHFPIYENDQRVFVKYSEKTNLISEIDYENIKGVCSFKPDKDTNTIYSVDFRFDEEFINEIKKYAKGFFFVR
jgi:hypothetical protein